MPSYCVRVWCVHRKVFRFRQPYVWQTISVTGPENWRRGERGWILHAFPSSQSLCLHVYFSKFNRCQLIQFCDYCCARLVSVFVPLSILLCPVSFLISPRIIPCPSSLSADTRFDEECQPATADHLSWWNCLFFCSVSFKILCAVNAPATAHIQLTNFLGSFHFPLIPLDSFYFKRVHYVSCNILSFIFSFVWPFGCCRSRHHIPFSQIDSFSVWQLMQASRPGLSRFFDFFRKFVIRHSYSSLLLLTAAIFISLHSVANLLSLGLPLTFFSSILLSMKSGGFYYPRHVYCTLFHKHTKPVTINH